MRRATRRVRTRVFHDPAPAWTHTPVEGESTAWRWGSVRAARTRANASGPPSSTLVNSVRAGRMVPRVPRLSVGCAGAEVVRWRSHIRRHLGVGRRHGGGAPRMAAYPSRFFGSIRRPRLRRSPCCLLYTSDAADDLTRVDLGGRRII